MRKPKRSSFYGGDLAHVHHTGFGDFLAAAAPELLAILHRAGVCAGTVVDLGCGGGQWLRVLGEHGYDAVGVDVSPALAARARREAPDARVVTASIYDFALPLCDAVTALGEVLGYLPPDGARIPSFERFFRRVARALRPGGVLAFDLVVRNPKAPLHTRNWRSGDDWAVLAETIEDPKRGRLVRDVTTFRRVGAGERWRRGHELHRVRVPSRRELLDALRAAGFAVRAAAPRYGSFALGPGRLGFVATRRR